MHKVIILAVLILVTIGIGQTWQLEQIDSVSSCRYVKLVRDGGTLWLSYATPDAHVRVARYDSVWTFEDIDTAIVRSGGLHNPLSMAISPSGQPAVAVGKYLARRIDDEWRADSVPLPVFSSEVGFDPSGRAGLVCLTDTWDIWLAVLDDSGWFVQLVRDETDPQYVRWADVGQPAWTSDGRGVLSYSFSYDMGGIITWGGWATCVQQGDSWAYIRSGGGRSSGGEAFSNVVDGADSVHVFWTEGGLYTINMTAFDSDSIAGPSWQGACVLDSLDRPHVVWAMGDRAWYGYRDNVWRYAAVPGTELYRWGDVAVGDSGQPIVAFMSQDGSVWLARGIDIVGAKEPGARSRIEAIHPTIMRAAELGRMDCRVLDITGRDVTERKTRLSPGVYFLKPSADRRPRTAATKVIIQH